MDESATIVVVFELLVSSAQKRVWRSMTGVVEIIADSDLISESEARDLGQGTFRLQKLKRRWTRFRSKRSAAGSAFP